MKKIILPLLTLILIGCDRPQKVVCPDGETVFHYPDPTKNYENFATSFESNLKIATNVIKKVNGEISGELNQDLKKLREDLDQYSGRQRDILMSSIIRSNQFPCDKDLRRKTDELYAQMQTHSKEVEDLRLRLSKLSDSSLIDSTDNSKVTQVLNDFKGTQEEIETINEKDVNDISYSNEVEWVIVFTADNNLEQAEYEIDQLKKAEINEVRLFLRNGKYRTLSKAFSSKSSAESYLSGIKNKVRNDVYIVNLKTWCLNKKKKENYFECR